MPSEVKLPEADRTGEKAQETEPFATQPDPGTRWWLPVTAPPTSTWVSAHAADRCAEHYRARAISAAVPIPAHMLGRTVAATASLPPAYACAGIDVARRSSR